MVVQNTSHALPRGFVSNKSRWYFINPQENRHFFVILIGLRNVGIRSSLMPSSCKHLDARTVFLPSGTLDMRLIRIFEAWSYVNGFSH